MAAKVVLITLCLQVVLSCLLLFPVVALPLERFKYSGILKEINGKGPYLGLVTVYPTEEDAFLATNAFKPNSKTPYIDVSGRRFRIGKLQKRKAIYVRCGIGLVNAAAATQQLVDIFNIRGIIHFGISGNTNSSMNIGDVTIPSQFVNTGLWDWLKPNATIPSNDIATLEIRNYNVPKGGNNSLGHIGFSPEQFYSETGEPNTAQQIVWFNATNEWLQLASPLEELELEQCVNSTICLDNEPKVVIGLKGSTSNIFVDNAAYRDFLFETFGVSSADMESTAVIMTSLSNGIPIIVIRGVSDLAGAQKGTNSITLFGSLAASNVAQVVVQFASLLPKKLFLES